MKQRRIASIWYFSQAGGGGACAISAALIVSKPPFAVEPGVSQRRKVLMLAEEIRALSVVDAECFILGIATVADFMRLANLDLHEGLGQRSHNLVMGRSGQPTTIRENMPYPVQSADVAQCAMG